MNEVSRGRIKTLVGIMALVKDGHNNVTAKADELERALYTPKGVPHYPRCDLVDLCRTQRDRLNWLMSELDGMRLL